jgi:hypothetical protein
VEVIRDVCGQDVDRVLLVPACRGHS